ncbi:unnamed protein product (macronuclear) [Paramecium tetraurelia]|uniref:RNA-binding S4 domain-containing protein n=1 Tax=Paramecium tetraurelia TaxID=5888 RepID=A0CHK9_PARTE|nr:uncharacterized protein GSPATT00038378001 [Paramecium tetraurelia]CAK70276.1 unnamed protein product [Paramecium tetraurelia]|eukprot:XP_001437673.1 hypothetical protein (macronuclear) [Paramecium tetraurelia strain d4-2]
MIINKFFAAFSQLISKTSQVAKQSLTKQNLIQSEPMRLSKYLAQTSVCSRREAEKMIESGMILVDGKKVDSNIPVTSENKIQVFTKNGERMPVKQSTKVWIFYKPIGMICSHNDPFKRPSFYDFAKLRLKTDQHIISVGRLDFNSEGLIVVTNDGELARCMELPETKLQRIYRVRVYGTFTEEKLKKIRNGLTIAGVNYGPYWVNVENRQSRNTWLIMRLESGKNREIRKVMQKFDLRVNRLIRQSYGPYKLMGLKPGDFYEAQIEPEIKRKLYLQARKKLQNVQEQIQLEQTKLNIKALDEQSKNEKQIEKQENDQVQKKNLIVNKFKKVQQKTA